MSQRLEHLEDKEISAADAEVLFQASGSDLLLLLQAADEMRARAVGREVTYVVNRNINFTNVCFLVWPL